MIPMARVREAPYFKSGEDNSSYQKAKQMNLVSVGKRPEKGRKKQQLSFTRVSIDSLTGMLRYKLCN